MMYTNEDQSLEKLSTKVELAFSYFAEGGDWTKLMEV